ncbi:adoMet-dependent rRNA methyltransferase SPB1 [Drechslerella stenobrocha 248]|uniref:AdoMet-dependent rRNA methyltransferase SPB1 n=1 Tax=Drechslerella stenobrocha 248 TaxID=1043628 RepID=W7HXH2_9PEZI|nr:adoMet-dependent rRNA methyltransferase SPB1 [Drechslerella stenobrocha 248]
MGIQKKHGKGRLDKWYKLAKEKNYRARSAFKLIQLNQKYGFLQKSRVLIDLCAAPGGWLQVAAENMPNSSLIVGVDLAPIKPIPKVISFVADITTDKCRSTLRQHLKTWKADAVLHDGAPNVGAAWVQDAFSQAELVLQSLRLATEFLAEGGTFVTKIFRSKDYNSLLWVFNQLFKKVEATKPPSSRNVSAEIFVVCRGYLAPKRVDPKFLDPKTVFEELPDATPNNEAKVYNPEKKKRKRDGYEEGDNLLYKEVPVKQFIETTDPIALLGSMNKFTFTDKNDIATAAISRMEITTQEIRNCCNDLRVLGRRDFKLLLKWRLAIRDKFGWSAKKKKEEAEAEEAAKAMEQAETTEITPMDEELKLEEDLKNMHDKETTKKKKEKRKENERKQKEIVRLQMHMTAPMDIALEQNAGPGDEQSMFKLKAIDSAGGLKEVTKGKMNMVVDEEEAKARAAAAAKDEESGSEESDEADDELDDELDRMYEQFVQQKAERDDKFKAKRARKEGADDEWEGIGDAKADVTSDEEVIADDDDDDDDSEDDSEGEEDPKQRLVTSLDHERASSSGLSKKAALFFDQDIFKEFGDIGGGTESTDEEDDSDDAEMEVEESVTEGKNGSADGSDQDDSSATIEDADEWYDTRETADSEDDDVSDSGIEIVSSKKDNMWDANEKDLDKNGKPDIDIITAEAMTLAQQIALGKKSKADLIDDGFNKYSFRSKEGLPEWFLEDEARHSKPLRPITAAGSAAIKEKLRALNARPIKKVKEAKDRKKFKAHQRLEKLKKKSAMLMEDEGISEKEKAQQITRMINRATKKKPKQSVKLVVAKNGNRGVQGRPKGVKGKYKIVDARMKKDKSRMKKKK